MASYNDLNSQNGHLTGPAPASAPNAAAPSSSGGFKLKLKMKAPTAATTTSTPTPAVASPAPTVSSASPAPAPPAQQSYQPPPIAQPSPITQPPPPAASVPATGPTSAVPQPPPATPAVTKSKQPAQRPPELVIDVVDDSLEAREARGVSTSKYRELKRQLIQATQDKDNTTLTLHRAQKLVIRLREEKSALLDRVLALETAAGITTAEVDAVQQRPADVTDARAFPLLNPPYVPSLADQIYRNAGHDSSVVDDSSLSLPPRLRSKAFMTELAAQKLRDDDDAKRAAQSLSRGAHSAIAILGVEGSYIAENVERALAGEQFGVGSVVNGAAPAPAPPQQSTSKGSAKRKRHSNSPAVRESLQELPNPFSFGTALPAAVESSPVKVEQGIDSASSPHIGMAYPSYQQTPLDADDDAASARSGSYSEDEGPAGDSCDATTAAPQRPKPSKKSRKSDISGRKVKRVRVQSATPGVHTIPHTPRNPDGTPALPLPVGIMTLNNLGTVIHEDGFSNERYIFPVGYEAVRKYPSMVARADTVDYTCRIAYSAEGPKFEVYPADQPGVVITAGTPTGAWSQIVKAANVVRERNHTNSVSGPDYFALSHNIVKALIQELPGAGECRGYIWQTFQEEPHPDELARRKAAAKKGGASAAGAGAGQRRHSGRPEDDAGLLPSLPTLPQHQQPQGYPAYSPHGVPTLPPLPPPNQAYGAGGPVYASHRQSVPYSHDPYGSPSSSHPGILPLPVPGQASADAFDPYALPIGGAGGDVPGSAMSASSASIVDPYAIPLPAASDPYAIPRAGAS